MYAHCASTARLISRKSNKLSYHCTFFGALNIIYNTENKMKRYVCDVCGYVYDEETGDPENGIAEGTRFEDLPENFECPLCNAGKDHFSEAE